MSAQSQNIYDQAWNPRDYLRQYYSKNYVPDDEEATYQHIIPYLKRKGRRFARALDFGCGPTVHLLTPLAPWVEEIHLADYLPDNLLEIRKWLEAEADAQNWDLNIRRALEIETGAEVNGEEIEARKQLLRSKVTALNHCDVRQAHPLGNGSVYDLVLSAYCVDAATDSKQEWRQLMCNLLTLCADGGLAIIVTSRKSQHYKVGDKKFPYANVDEEDLAAALNTSGFNPNGTEIEAIQIKDWAAEGFDSIVITIAEKE